MAAKAASAVNGNNKYQPGVMAASMQRSGSIGGSSTWYQ